MAAICTFLDKPTYGLIHSSLLSFPVTEEDSNHAHVGRKVKKKKAERGTEGERAAPSFKVILRWRGLNLHM